MPAQEWLESASVRVRPARRGSAVHTIQPLRRVLDGPTHPDHRWSTRRRRYGERFRLTSGRRAPERRTWHYSEFGRRVIANANEGTDHGTAGPVFIIGEAVAGGFYGDEPSLTRPNAGDLVATTDLRDVYATLLEKVLWTEPDKVLTD